MSPSLQELFVSYSGNRTAGEILTSFVLVSSGTWLAYHLVKVIYNLFFHPLAHIPGPLLSRATYIPEFWYDVVRSGLYTKQIQKMHDKYGL